jgi:BMFP domain-containing protein YqiC
MMGETGNHGGGGGNQKRRGGLFDDLAGVAGGAFSALAGLRTEMEQMARSQMEAMVQRLELVRREDLDAALEVARRAREEAESLAVRVAALEARLASAAAPQPGEGTVPPDASVVLGPGSEAAVAEAPDAAGAPAETSTETSMETPAETPLETPSDGKPKGAAGRGKSAPTS